MKLLHATLLCAFLIGAFSAYGLHKGKNVYVKGPNGEAISGQLPKIFVDPNVHFNAFKGAAMDTIFWDDFDQDTVVQTILTGGPWLNYDLDGGNPANGGLPTDYFIWEQQPVYSMINGDTLYFTNVAASYSWLTPTDSNFNDLVTALGVPITKTGTVLRFTSYPQQGPQWMEGYTLKVDVVNGDPYEPTADTLLFHKQYVSGDGPLWDPSLVWWPSHADTIFGEFYYDSTMTSKADSGNAYVGPTYNEFNLDAYVGQTIFIHFFHDSYDDVALWIDDVGVFEPQTTGLERKEEFHLGAYPNPSSDYLNIEFSAGSGEIADVELVDLTGKVVMAQNGIATKLGMNELVFDVAKLESGIYLLRTTMGEKFNSTKVAIH